MLWIGLSFSGVHIVLACLVFVSPASVVDSKSAPETCKKGIKSWMFGTPRHFIWSFFHNNEMVMMAPAHGEGMRKSSARGKNKKAYMKSMSRC
jgi:hypothetical protein